MSVLPNMLQRFNTIPMKIPADFFLEIGKQIIKFTGKFKECRIAKIILKKNKVEGFTLLDFKTYYEAPTHETVWY